MSGGTTGGNVKARVVMCALVIGGLLGAGPVARAADNDNFADSEEITMGQTVETSTLLATDELLEPESCGVGRAVWYSFVATEEGLVTLNTAGSDFDTVIAVYTGSASPPLWNLRRVGCNDDSAQSYQASFTFDAVAGMTYYIQAGGFFGDTGSLTLGVFQPGGIEGTVSVAGFEDPAYACIAAYDADGLAVASSYSDDDGSYALYGLRPGDYTIRFSPCGGIRFATEWYNDKPSRETADVVTVATGTTITGIDAILTPVEPVVSPIDGLVESMTIENVPLKTDHGTHPGTGTVRDVMVTVRNIGEVAASGYVDVRACPATALFCHHAGSAYVSFGPGESRTVTVRWNGAGGAGDYSVEVFADFFDDEYETWDRDYSNNSLVQQHYLIVGGTGFGVGV